MTEKPDTPIEPERCDSRGRPCRTCQVWLTCELLDKVAQRARAEGLSDSALIARALRRYLGVPEEQ